MKCNDANHICDKTQYKESGFWERLKLSIHLLYCHACRKYSANNTKLSEIMKQSKVEIIKTSEKEKMKSQLKKEMAK